MNLSEKLEDTAKSIGALPRTLVGNRDTGYGVSLAAFLLVWVPLTLPLTLPLIGLAHALRKSK